MNDNYNQTNETGSKNDKISIDLKTWALNYIEKNPKVYIAEVARSFSIKEGTFRRIHRPYKLHGEIRELSRGGRRNFKITQIHEEKIESYLQYNPLLTGGQIKEKLNQDCQLTISKSTITKKLKKMSITFKIARIVPIVRNLEVSIEARFRYAGEYFDR